MRPRIGDPAPDITLKALTGADTSLSRTWADGTAVISFLRYFGCPFCQAWVGRLAGQADAFERAGAEVVLIGQGTVGAALGFTGPRSVPFEVLLDPDRSGYRAYGLSEGGAAELFTPTVAVAYVGVHLRREGRQGGLQGGSASQMPGTFVVDRAGIVRFVHRSQHQAQDPDLPALLSICRALGDESED